MAEICLVMIARDEARSIERCLASVAPWVDRMLVLDTGSRDATPALAARAGARVERFEWSDDFSAARNAALDAAGADWNLVLDADEWLVAGGELLAALRTTAPRLVGSIEIDSSFEHDGRVHHAPSWLPRVLPRGVRYAGRVHEQPVHRLGQQRLGVRVGHDGYEKQQMHSKQGRNRRLLQQSLAEHPGDVYLHYQLGKDFEVHGDHAQAALHYASADADRAPATWRHDLVLRRLYCLKKLARHAEAFVIAESEMARFGGSADFCFTLGDVLLDWALAEPARANELLPAIEASWTRALELGDAVGLEGAVAGRGSWLAAHNLAALHTSFGREGEARRYRALGARLLREAGRN